MRWLLGGVLMLGLVLAPPVSAQAAEPAPGDVLERALADYATALAEADRDARLAGFARAEQGFAAVLASGAENAALQTNLGNAALQAEHLGSAVLAYRRALRLDPDARTARQNLTHLRGQLPSWVPRPDFDEETALGLLDRVLSPAQRSRGAALCFAVAGICFAVSIRRTEGAWRGLAIFAGLLWLGLLASVVVSAGEGRAPAAVVVASEAPARSADSPLAPLALPEPLPAGVEVEQLEARGEWTRVRLANGRDVWLRSSSLALVAGPSGG